MPCHGQDTPRAVRLLRSRRGTLLFKHLTVKSLLFPLYFLKLYIYFNCIINLFIIIKKNCSAEGVVRDQETLA